MERINNYIEYDGTKESMSLIEELCHSEVDHLEGSMFNQIYVHNDQCGSFMVREGDYVVLDCNGVCEPIAHHKFDEN